jgi:hypothetical protein
MLFGISIFSNFKMTVGCWLLAKLKADHQRPKNTKKYARIKHSTKHY